MTSTFMRTQSTEPPGAQLSRPPNPWNMVILACAVLGVIGSSLLWIQESTLPAIFAATASGLGTAAAVIASARHARRQLIVDNAVEALAPILGVRNVARSLVKATRWRGGFTGYPQMVSIRYGRTINDHDGVWRAKVVDTAARNFDGTYKVDAHDRRRKHLKLRLDVEEMTKESAKTAEALRAQNVIQDLLGKDTTVDTTEDADGIKSIEVTGIPSAKLSIGARRSGVERVIAASMPGRLKANWDLEHDRVEFQRRKPLPTMIRPPHEHSPIALDHEVYKDFKVPLAVAEEEELLEWWVAVQAHLMVVGGTGSGKTVLLHGATQRVTQAGWRTWVIDGKRIEFIGFRGWPNVEIVAARIEHQVRAVLAAHELMEERYSRVEVGEASLADFEPLLLVIDELTTFLKRAERWWKKVKPKGAPVKPPVLELIADIARLGRSAKIHMIVGLQRPDVEFVGGEMRDNFGARVSMGRLSPQGAMMMWDSAAIGVSIPRTARGRAICLNSQSRPVEAQTFFAPNPDPNSPGYDQDFVNSVRPKATLYSRKMIEVLEAKEDIDGETIPLTFDDYAAAEIIQYDAEYEKLHARIPSADNDRRNPILSTKALLLSEAPAETESDDSPESDPEDLFKGYEPEAYAGPEELTAGDLILVDENLGQWGVVESVEPDFRDDAALTVDYRDFESGEPETITLSSDSSLTTRRPSTID